LIGRKDFHNFHWTRGTNSKRGCGKLGWEDFFFNLVFSLEEEENECVRGKLVVMCEEMLFMEANVCKQKNMEGSSV
jgi:hypothetical protein